MTITFHAGPGPDGRAAGKPRTGRMQANDVGLAKQVRTAVHQLASRSRLTGLRLDQLTLATIKADYRRAVPLLGEEPIAALTRRLEPGACSWCAARLLCAVNDKPMPKPIPAMHALLGAQCGRCRGAYRARQVARREQAHVDQLVAAGYSPEDAAYQRPGDPRATGTIWSAGKTPAPSYYRPRRPR